MVKLAFLSEMARRFRRDERGNVLVMTAFLLVPLIGIAGITVDYSRASNTRQALSAAIDAAALMAARDAQKLTDDELRKRIDAWIRDNLPDSAKSEFTTATVVIDRAARMIKIEANGDVPTTISRVLGTQSLSVASNSQSTWGTNTIELALVLDNTGSMAKLEKMTNLKAAAKDLINIMKAAATNPDQIRISIVPFNTQVRVPRSFKDEAWLRHDMTRKVNCDRWGNNCTTQTLSKASWAKNEGCVIDRDKTNDVGDGGSYSIIEQQYPAYWCSQTSLVEIMPLTSDWAALTSRVENMSSAGATNVTIGAVWGWATLSTGAPYSEAKPATEPRLRKYMILLTDGDNTQNRWDGNGQDHSSAVDDRTKIACSNIKAAGIDLYTIRVIAGNASLLKECASKPEMYYDVQDAAQLSPIFKQIANEISAVRLTH